MVLRVLTGKGITTISDSGKIKVNIPESDYIKLNSDGIYVSSLKGSNGPSGETRCDGICVKEIDYGNSNYYPDCDRNKVVMVESEYLDPNTSHVLVDFVNKHNKPLIHGEHYASYKMVNGDMFMVRSPYNDDLVNVSGNYDDGKRHPGDQCKAMFHITKILYGEKDKTYDGYNLYGYIISLTVKCIYSVITGFTKGIIYSCDYNTAGYIKDKSQE